jgi:hypothetical protein
MKADWTSGAGSALGQYLVESPDEPINRHPLGNAGWQADLDHLAAAGAHRTEDRGRGCHTGEDRFRRNPLPTEGIDQGR